MKLGESLLEELWFGEDDAAASTEQARNSLAAKLGELDGLRPLPAVVHKLIARLGSSEYHARDVRLLIEEDPALAARVLRIANSPAYAGREPTAGVQEAIVRIGGRGVREIVLAVATMTALRDVSGFGAAVRDHSASTAAIARYLAELAHKPSDGLFMAGLLHDVGKMLMLQSGELRYVGLIKHFSGGADRIHLRERELFGYDHAVLGGHVLARWRLPEPIPKLVAWHHQPMRAYAAGGEIAAQVGLLRIADLLSDALLTPEAEPLTLDAIAQRTDANAAGLDPDCLEELWPKLLEISRGAKELLA